MCKLTKDFKLCTCDETKRRPKNYWVLYRGEKEVMESVMGSIVEPDIESPLMKGLVEQISITEDLLNNSNLFDFEYQEEEGDRLLMCHNGFEYWLMFSKAKWKEEGSIIPFDHPDNFYEEYLKGKIKGMI